MEDSLVPLPKTEIVPMTFYEALKKVIKGEYVARAVWQNNDYCLLKDGILSIYRNNAFHIWAINDGDMEGVDWIVIKLKTDA
jgi:hypothetical protein